MLPGRDNHEGMPEIVAAYERDGYFFGVVQVMLDGAPHAFEFCLDKPGYRSLKQVFQFRPFDALPGILYRYFFTGSVSRSVDESGAMGAPIRFYVRVEQGRNAKVYAFEGPLELVANLRWFFELRRPDDAAHLRRVKLRLEL